MKTLRGETRALGLAQRRHCREAEDGGLGETGNKGKRRAWETGPGAGASANGPAPIHSADPDGSFPSYLES